MEDIKALFTRLIESAKELFKKVVNTYRIPSLVDFVFKSGKEALNSAKPASENWIRLGLEKTWQYFVLVIVVLLVYFFKGSLQFAIEVIAQFGIVAVLGFTGYWLWKSFK